MYAVYHGPKGLLRIADRIRVATSLLREGLRLGYQTNEAPVFDTLKIRLGSGALEGVWPRQGRKDQSSRL